MTYKGAHRQGNARRTTVIRVTGGGVAVLSMMGLISSLGAGAANAEQKVHKSYVCKYVDKPGEAERLQTGNNPIWVDNHALLGYDGETYVGQEFKDRQGRSVVIVANSPKLNPEPGIEDCPAPTPTTTTTTTPTTTTTTTPTTTTTTTPTTTTTTPTTTTTKPTTTTTKPTTTTTKPTTTTTKTPPPTTTPTGGESTPASSTSTNQPAPGTYPLQPVNAGAGADSSGWTLLTRYALVALALLGLLALATGGQLPRVRRTVPRRK
jgi:hypothetical protein